MICVTCHGPIEWPNKRGWHQECEPTTCTCGPLAAPDGLGECGRCRRLVLSHSWHNGRPKGAAA